MRRALISLVLLLPLPAVAGGWKDLPDGVASVELDGVVEVALYRGEETDAMPAVRLSIPPTEAAIEAAEKRKEKDPDAPDAEPEEMLAVISVGTGMNILPAGTAKALRLDVDSVKIPGVKTPQKVTIVPEVRVGDLVLRDVRFWVESRAERVELGASSMPELAVAVSNSTGTVRFAPAAKADELLTGEIVAGRMSEPSVRWVHGNKVPFLVPAIALPATVGGQEARAYFSTGTGRSTLNDSVPRDKEHQSGGLLYGKAEVALGGVTLPEMDYVVGGLLSYFLPEKDAAIVGNDVLWAFDVAADPSTGRVSFTPVTELAFTDPQDFVFEQKKKDFEESAPEEGEDEKSPDEETAAIWRTSTGAPMVATGPVTSWGYGTTAGFVGGTPSTCDAYGVTTTSSDAALTDPNSLAMQAAMGRMSTVDGTGTPIDIAMPVAPMSVIPGFRSMGTPVVTGDMTYNAQCAVGDSFEVSAADGWLALSGNVYGANEEGGASGEASDDAASEKDTADPKQMGRWGTYGKALFEADKPYDEVREAFAKAAEFAGDNCMPYLEYAGVLYAGGDFELAEEQARKAGELWDTWYRQPLDTRLRVAEKQKNLPPGTFETKQPGSCHVAWSMVAAAAFAQGDHEAVEQVFDEHLSYEVMGHTYEFDGRLAFVYGVSKLERDEADLASGAFRRAINLGERNDPTVRNALSLASLELGRDQVVPKQAERFLAIGEGFDLVDALGTLEATRRAAGDEAAKAFVDELVEWRAPRPAAYIAQAVDAVARGDQGTLDALKGRVGELQLAARGYFATPKYIRCELAVLDALAGDVEAAREALAAEQEGPLPNACEAAPTLVEWFAGDDEAVASRLAAMRDAMPLELVHRYRLLPERKL